MFKETKKELKKVVWPDKDELKEDVITVICSSGVLALVFWAVSSGVLSLFRLAV